MGGIRRTGWLAALVALGLLVGAGSAAAQTPTTGDAPAFNLEPTESCPQSDIQELQRVIRFVQGKSWAEDPGSTSFLLSPDTASCRVVLRISEVSTAEQAALEQAGEGRLSIERTKDRAEPSRLPLILWVIFGGAGLVFVFRRYGKR